MSIKKDTEEKVVRFANMDAPGHVTGRSLYVDDVPVMQGTLFAKIFDSPYAHARIKKLDYYKAALHPGVVNIFSADDIPGANQIGGIIADEPLMANEEVLFQGQPILLIVAE